MDKELGPGVACASFTNMSALKPDHAIKAAILSTSGRLPCAIRVSVEALTRASSATSFQVCRRLLRSASRAEKNASASNRRFPDALRCSV